MTLDPTIKLDIRYATADNFVGRPVYPEARAFLQRPAAEALIAAHRWLTGAGYGMIVYDAYRPWTITKLFWDMTPASKKSSSPTRPSGRSTIAAAPWTSACSTRRPGARSRCLARTTRCPSAPL